MDMEALGRSSATVRQPATRERRSVRPVRAKYDAAQTTTDNTRHWAQADAYSAASSNSLAVRKKLRERARYEVANNSYARGIILTQANDTIGCGPRLQIRGQKRTVAQQIETAFALWAKKVRLAEKLRLARMAKAQDGEVILKLFTNPSLRGQIKLDVEVIEADRLQSISSTSSNVDDSVEYDAYGNPTLYRILRYHPGDVSSVDGQKRDEVKAEFVIHLFRMDRPGQLRGVPEITPALPLFAKLRAFTLSTVEAAQTAANYTAVLQTSQTPDNGPNGEALDTLEIERNMMTVLPDGYSLGQFKPEQPTTTYPQFKAEIIKEIARCMNMTFNIASGDSSGYNYSSGRLDHLLYHRANSIERDYFESHLLDRLFESWYDEAALTPGVLPSIPTSSLPVRHVWIWDANQSIDPQKDAGAAIMLLEKGLLTEQDYQAEQGCDWEEVLDQKAIEEQARKDRELPSILKVESVPMAPVDPNADQQAQGAEYANAA